MSTIEIRCPDCGHLYTLEEEFAGQKICCAECAAKFVIPAAGHLNANGLKNREWSVGDTILDLYEVTGILGEGGMGRVYRVHHKGWNTDLAVKSPKSEMFADAGAVSDFERECETWIDLGLHPHIVSCYYVREIEGIPRVFAECVEGGNLSEWIRDGRLFEGGPQKALERILDIAIQFAWGLDYAHQKGLIHLDVKPGNLMAASDGTVKVTDFGLAKARMVATDTTQYTPEQSILLTSGGMTPGYCSPEQFAGEKLSRKTDIWSWGVSVLEMFTGGVTWYSGTLAGEALERLLQLGVQDERIPEMPVALANLLFRCFDDDINSRPSGFEVVTSALTEIWQNRSSLPYERSQPKSTMLTAASLNNHAISLVDLKQIDKALQTWERALVFDPNHPESAYNRGISLWHSGQVDDWSVVTKLQEICESDPSNWRAPYLTGLVQMERGDIQGAIDKLEKATQAAGESAETKYELELAKSMLSMDSRCSHTITFGDTEDKDIGVLVNTVSVNLDAKLALIGGETKCFAHYRLELEPDWEKYVPPSGRLWSWHLESGLIRQFEGNFEPVKSVNLSADALWGLTEEIDSETLRLFRLWDMSAEKPLATFEKLPCDGISKCQSNDNRWTLTVEGENSLQLHDVFEGKFVCKFPSCSKPTIHQNRSEPWWTESKYHNGCSPSWATSDDGHWALSESLSFWDTLNGRCIRTLKGRVSSHALNGAGSWGVTMNKDFDNSLYTFDLWDFRLLVAQTYKCPLVLSNLISSDAAQISENQYNKLIKQGEISSQEGDWGRVLDCIRQARQIPGYEGSSKIVALSGKAQRHCYRSEFYQSWFRKFLETPIDILDPVFLCGTGPSVLYRRKNAENSFGDPVFLLRDLRTGETIRKFGVDGEYIDKFCLSLCGNFALSASDTDLTRCEPLLEKHVLREIRRVRAQPKTRGVEDRKSIKRFRLWEVNTGKCICISELSEDHTVDKMCVSPDCRLALTSSDNLNIKLWDITSGICLRTFEELKVDSLSFSPDGSMFLSSGRGKSTSPLGMLGERRIRLWDVKTGDCVHQFCSGEDDIKCCFSPDGRWILSFDGPDVLKLWNVKTGQCDQVFESDSDWSTSISVCSDGLTVLTTGYNTVRLWDVTTGRCLRTLDGNAQCISSVSLSKDGRWALGRSDCALLLWELDWQYEYRGLRDWDEGARAYLHNFLTLQTPLKATLPLTHKPAEAEIIQFLTREGKPIWNEEEIDQLMETLAYSNFGWLRKEGVTSELEKMAENWTGPPPLPY